MSSALPDTAILVDSPEVDTTGNKTYEPVSDTSGPILDEETVNPSNPGNDFLPFLRLPAETRVMIWALAASVPRIVQVLMYYVLREVDEKYKDYYHSKPKFVSNTSIPSILHVNQESRIEALKLYKLSLFGPRQSGTIYFNRLVDTVYYAGADGWIVDYTELFDHLDCFSDAGIRYLALDGDRANPTEFHTDPYEDYKALKCFDSLVELIFFEAPSTLLQK